MTPQFDDSPAQTQLLKGYLLDCMADNGKHQAIMAPEFTRNIKPRERVDQALKIKDIKSLSFIAREDLSKKMVWREGSRLDEIRYCRLINPQGTFIFTSWMM